MADNKDRELDAYMEGSSILSSEYKRTAVEQPSADLDDAILAASRRETGSRPGHVFNPFTSGWHVPLSVAALVVICVTVFINIQERQDPGAIYAPETLDEVGQYGTSTLAPISRKIEGAGVPAGRAGQGRDAAPELEQSKDSSKNLPAAMASPAQKQDQIAPDNNRQIYRREMPTALMKLERSKAKSPSPMGAIEEGFVPPPAEPGEDLAPIAERATSSKGLDPARRRMRAESDLEFEARLPAKKAAELTRESYPVKESKASADLALAQDALSYRPETRWLDEIKTLWKNGEEKRAIEELARFRKSYPDYDLAGQLEQALLDRLEPED